MATGTVKWYDYSKGYGFIISDDSGELVFAHHSQIKLEGSRVLFEGQRVEYDETQDPKGKKASNIYPI